MLIDAAVRFIFPNTTELLKTFNPLTYDIAVREILIPEAATRIIQDDLKIGREDAVAVLEQSYTFGIVLHPDNDDCEFYTAATRSISMSHSRAQWALPVYEASGSTLGFEAWLQKQKELETAVIDLTNDD